MQMTLYKMVKSNLFFLLVVLALNYLFLLQQPLEGSQESYASFATYYTAHSGLFLPLLFLISFLLCLFSFPGAGFSLSVGGFLLGLEYWPVASFILFLSTWASFPFSKQAKLKSSFFRKIVNTYKVGGALNALWPLFFLRMNPAIPFIFFAAFHEKKLNFKSLVLFALSSAVHAFLYVFLGWNIRTLSFDSKSLSLFLAVFMVLTLLPVFLVFRTKES